VLIAVILQLLTLSAVTLYLFLFSECPKFCKVLEVARGFGPNYQPPDCWLLGGKLMDSLFNVGFADLMCSLLSESEIFGISGFGDGATIKSIPLINILAVGPNNPLALLNIVDSTAHLLEGGKKDAPYLANMILPHVMMMELVRDENNKHFKGVVDLVLFDGASNVQKAGQILAINHP
jgi:hypothetical protein